MKKTSILFLALLLAACGPAKEEQTQQDSSSSSSSSISSNAEEIVSEVDITKVKTIITDRCATCHSAKPSDDVFKVAPSNVMFDTLEQMQRYAGRIHARAVITQTMPPFANKTQMTEAERALIGGWIKAGAKIK